MNPNIIKIDEIEYVRKDSMKDSDIEKNIDGLKYVIVRTYSAGVFAGYLYSRDNKEVVLKNARRLWYWSGAASLSQLAMEGVSKPKECKFPCEVNEIILTESIEIITCTKKAKESIESVPVWSE